MTLASLADFVCKKVGKTDATSVGICKDFLRQRHEMIYDTGLWKDSVKIEQFCLKTNERGGESSSIALFSDVR